ncbi:hypothetical protein EYC84_008010 [Monilinia fructicola]|uniref:Uncharacterized protein n=1 Tax=Monilinia fructicola TaxID=38448 RepID=A0A5M9JDV5_MONFR|nr:hypothetical protein EYC84_008010 [Monilinia fructicola]
MTSTMDYENENGTRYEDEAPRYERDRSASPRPTRRNDSPRGGPRRSASPDRNGRADERSGPKNDRGPGPQDDGAVNPGSNLFVTGIHPRLLEEEMITSDQADAAKEGLQGEVIEGRTLSIEKARRARPRTPTPGKYFGPPKRDDPRGPPRGGWGGDRYDDRRRGGGYRYEPYGGGRYGGRDDRDRGYSRRDRDDYNDAPRGIDRYAGPRDGGDRYSRGGDERRGGGYQDRDRYDRGGRDDRPARDPAPAAAYGDQAPRGDAREPYGGGERPAR